MSTMDNPMADRLFSAGFEFNKYARALPIKFLYRSSR
jgi:hypothetical protein